MEPTTSDILRALDRLASKDDLGTMTDNINQLFEKSEKRIDVIDTKISTINEQHSAHVIKINTLEQTVEQLKQDKLRCNVRISGLFPEFDGDAKGLVMKMITYLKVNATVNDFDAYTTTNNNFIIASFHNYVHKQSLTNKMRIKKSLLVEELFPKFKSNNQLYVNDHLTPFMNDIFITAFKAKKEGKLFSVSSWGGKIRVRKFRDDKIITIDSRSQLDVIINTDAGTQSNASFSTANGDTDPTPINTKQQKQKTTRASNTGPGKRGRKPSTSLKRQRSLSQNPTNAKHQKQN